MFYKLFKRTYLFKQLRESFNAVKAFFPKHTKNGRCDERIRNRKILVEKGRKAEENRGEKEVMKLRFDINDILLLRDSFSHWRIDLLKASFSFRNLSLNTVNDFSSIL